MCIHASSSVIVEKNFLLTPIIPQVDMLRKDVLAAFGDGGSSKIWSKDHMKTFKNLARDLIRRHNPAAGSPEYAMTNEDRSSREWFGGRHLEDQDSKVMTEVMLKCWRWDKERELYVLRRTPTRKFMYDSRGMPWHRDVQAAIHIACIAFKITVDAEDALVEELLAVVREENGGRLPWTQ